MSTSDTLTHRNSNDSCGPSFLKMPEYFEKMGFVNPQDPLEGPWQFAFNSPNAFVWLNENPKLLASFHAYIHGQREGRPTWTDAGFYPVSDRLVHDLKLEGDSSALVDIGGSVGQVLGDFLSAVPEWKGRLVLQEQQPVIDLAKGMGLDQRIELQVHDFFKEQPVKGARAYYMRYILHDWSDEPAKQILNQIKAVMEPGYSRILINDAVLADTNASWQHISLDLYMMGLASSAERTETEWRALIASVGLKIVNIYSKGSGNESLIEVILE